MASVSFKKLLKVVSYDELQALAKSSTSIKDLCGKLNFTYSQVVYLYGKVGIDLKPLQEGAGKPLLPKDAILGHIGKNLQVVCKELDLKPKQVKILFTQHGLPVPMKASNFASKCKISKQELEHEYVTLKQSLSVVGKKYGVSKQQVSNWLVFHQIPVRSAGSLKNVPKPMHPIWELSNEEFLKRAKLYATSLEFCESENMSIGLFVSFIKKRNLKTPFPRQLYSFTKEYIEDLYLNKSMTIKQIAEQEGCHWQTINRCLKAFGLIGRKPKTWLLGKRKKI